MDIPAIFFLGEAWTRRRRPAVPLKTTRERVQGLTLAMFVDLRVELVDFLGEGIKHRVRHPELGHSNNWNSSTEKQKPLPAASGHSREISDRSPGRCEYPDRGPRELHSFEIEG